MSRPRNAAIEYRNYNLPQNFPVILLTGEMWRISDVPSGRLHFHNCLEIGLCESDSGTLEFSDERCRFEADNVSFIAGDVPHTTYSTKGTASKWSYIFVDMEMLLSPFFPFDVLPDKELILDMLHNFHCVVSREAYPEIYHMVKMIIGEIDKRADNYQFTVRGLLYALMFKYLDLYKEYRGGGYELAHEDMKENSLSISPALNYIRNNYMLDFSIDDLANLCHMSTTHFRRVFNSIMRVNPLEYVNQIRIMNAAVLLRTTEMSVLSISEEVGFQSVSSFNRHFIRVYEMTPLAFRKEMSYIRNQDIFTYTGWKVPPASI
jgi:AraC-like DNA-binding protein